MKNHEKIIELEKAANKLRMEIIGVSGQAQAMASNLNISTETADNYKRLESRLDDALKVHNEKTDKIIFG